MELYLRIGALMEKHALTNQSMANLSGIPIGTISGIRSGKIQNPSFENVCAMLRAMGESADALIDGAQVGENPAPCIQDKIIQQTATVAAQAATLEARNESISHYRQRIAHLETELQAERKRVRRMQIALECLVVLIIALGAVYIWDVRNLHSGLTAFFNP